MIDLNTLPDDGLLRLTDICWDKKSGQRNILPMSKINFRRKVEEGLYPQPIKLAKNLYLWRVKDIKDLVARINRGEV